ncbi:hypothetical protein [Sulfitobacter sediminilitoris]|jgi:hypothetical protein|nr:hypothetical protein [Sulfitobacter sediminilitoris]
MMLREAEWADRFTQRLGKVHPVWGNGTLSDAASRRPLAFEVPLDDPEYCACLALVLLHLSHRPRSFHM